MSAAPESMVGQRLVKAAHDYGSAHDLTQIFAAIPSRDALAIEIDELANLTPYAVEMRYPGHWLMETREEATKAFEVATRIRDLLKPLLQP